MASSAPERLYVALKVLCTGGSPNEIRLKDMLKAPEHPFEQHVELALHSFTTRGPAGEEHFCKAVEPLGRSLSDILELAQDQRAELNRPRSWLGKARDGDAWSARFARTICGDVMRGVRFLHRRGIAHRDVQSANVCVSLPYDLSVLDENQVQQSVWPAEEEEEEEEEVGAAEGDHHAGLETVERREQPGQKLNGSKHDHHENQTAPDTGGSKEHPESKPGSDPDADSSDSDSDSDSDWEAEWAREHEEKKRLREESWKRAFAPGDANAEPHSPEWNKANFMRSRRGIGLLERKDGRPPGSGELRYTVAPSPLPDRFDLERANRRPEDPLRFKLIDLGFSCPFDRCERERLVAQAGYRPPEHLVGLPSTHRADVFSAGLLLWEVVMLRKLVEPVYLPPVGTTIPDRAARQAGVAVRDLVRRLGPLPPPVARAVGGRRGRVFGCERAGARPCGG